MTTLILSAVPKWFLQALRSEFSMASIITSLLMFFSFSRIVNASINSVFIFSFLLILKIQSQTDQGNVRPLKCLFCVILICDGNSIFIICFQYAGEFLLTVDCPVGADLHLFSKISLKVLLLLE